MYGFHSSAVDGENGPFEPFNEYGKTKLQAEAVYRAWAEEDPDRTLVIVLTDGSVWGREPRKRLQPAAANRRWQVLHGRIRD